MKISPRILTALAFLAVHPAGAQVASLVRDIAPQQGYNEESAADATEMTPLGDRLVFAGYDDVHGGELWASDGSVAGTELLTDACRGECGSAQFAGATKSLSFWRTDSPAALWRSDGTRAGTFQLLGNLSSDPSAAVRGNVLFFPACPAFSDCGLWRTDGTLAGTREILPDEVRHVTLAGNRVFLANGNELWRIDAGGETPVRVAAVGDIKAMTTLQNRVLMLVATGSGEELWASDGTASGTRALTSFANPDPFGSQPAFVTTARALYFRADDVEHGNELWASDGTPQGTRRITDIGYYFPFDGELLRTTLREVGTRVVFGATDGLSESHQIWATDGKPESTKKLLDNCPEGCGADLFSLPFETALAGDVVLFPADDAAHGIELWATDGTVQGTRLFRDLCPGACDSKLTFIPATPAEGVYFAGNDHVWKTDGTEAGTVRLTRQPLPWYQLLTPRIAVAGGKTFLRLGDDSDGSLYRLQGGQVTPLTFNTRLGSGSNPEGLLARGAQLVFLVPDAGESGIWQTAGTPETTLRLAPGPGIVERMIVAGDELYYFSYYDLWRVRFNDLQHVAEVQDGSGYGSGSAAALGGHLYFGVYRDGVSELWRTNGTAEPVLVRTLLAGLEVGSLVASEARLYFQLYDPAGDELSQVWVSDGTAAGTREILELPQYQHLVDRIVRAGGFDYFSTTYGSGFSGKLWRSDGTPEGTREVVLSDKPVGVEGEMIAHQGSLYLLGADYHEPVFVPALWRVDGDTAVRLRSFPAGAAELASVGDRVVFVGEHGSELWATDGTAAGTRMVVDLAPGSASSDISGLTVVGGRLFFAATDPVHGTELWTSDGTAAGTRMVHDISPGPASSRPQQLTGIGDRLYFTADDGLTGRELWTLSLLIPGCVPSARALCLQGDRFRVEASWRDFQLNLGEATAVPLTGDTGYFWFFDPANAEVILKVLDGRGLNDHFWVFYGALSNVEYTLTLTDTRTGVTQRYVNPMGHLASVGDTTGFGPAGAFSKTEPQAAPLLVRGWTAAVAAACEPGPQRLCLNGGRFAVEAAWKDFQGKTGKGMAVPLSNETGYFWFFDAANVEVLLKVLDGTPVNGKHWVFYGALSNVEYTLTVTDTLTGAVKEYRNPSGRFASGADTGAF